MRVERLDCPRGSVVVFKNKSAHAVEPKPVDSVTTRWNFGTVITNRLQAMLFVCVFTSMTLCRRGRTTATRATAAR